jgi:hypothetical protein
MIPDGALHGLERRCMQFVGQLHFVLHLPHHGFDGCEFIPSLLA